MMFIMVLDQLFYWNNIEEYHFGYMVPLFVIYILSDRWPRMKALLFEPEARVEGEGGGLAKAIDGLGGLLVPLSYAGLLACSLIFLLGGTVRATQGPANLASFMIALGFAGSLLSVAFICFHKSPDGTELPVYRRLAFAAMFLFPASIWIISTPMLIESGFFRGMSVRLLMQDWVSIIVEQVFAFFQEPIVRQGNTLILPGGERVLVEEACSGVRSLTACIFAGSFLGAIFFKQFWKKAALLVSAVFFAFLLNVCRGLFLTIWANMHGSGALERDFWGNEREILNEAGKMIPNPEFLIGTVHDIAGYAILGVTFLLLLGLVAILNIKLEKFLGVADAPEEAAPQEAGESSPSEAEQKSDAEH